LEISWIAGLEKFVPLFWIGRQRSGPLQPCRGKQHRRQPRRPWPQRTLHRLPYRASPAVPSSTHPLVPDKAPEAMSPMTALPRNICHGLKMQHWRGSKQKLNFSRMSVTMLYKMSHVYGVYYRLNSYKSQENKNSCTTEHVFTIFPGNPTQSHGIYSNRSINRR